ncbi:MAG TPA: hypothetical protein VGP55_08625 [Chitinophagaceae bacterium]|nr:hypothetical protein [Chitinophagaceae bacterium]
MEEKSNAPAGDSHNQLPSDEATRNKIHKHLRDINDTISEEDMENINTSIGTENSTANPEENMDRKEEADEKTEDDKRPNDDGDEKPKKEMPTSWDVIS